MSGTSDPSATRKSSWNADPEQQLNRRLPTEDEFARLLQPVVLRPLPPEQIRSFTGLDFGTDAHSSPIIGDPSTLRRPITDQSMFDTPIRDDSIGARFAAIRSAALDWLPDREGFLPSRTFVGISVSTVTAIAVAAVLGVREHIPFMGPDSKDTNSPSTSQERDPADRNSKNRPSSGVSTDPGQWNIPADTPDLIVKNPDRTVTPSPTQPSAEESPTASTSPSPSPSDDATPSPDQSSPIEPTETSTGTPSGNPSASPSSGTGSTTQSPAPNPTGSSTGTPSQSQDPTTPQSPGSPLASSSSTQGAASTAPNTDSSSSSSDAERSPGRQSGRGLGLDPLSR